LFLRTFPPIYRRLETSSLTELFEPFTGWFHTLEALNALSAVLVLAGKSNQFQCRFGIQTATTSLDATNAVVNPASAATQLGTAGTQQLVRFDPNGASDGNIDAATSFRVGVLYSLSSGSTLSSGDVELRNLCWR
jgi:hypothetical protein